MACHGRNGVGAVIFTADGRTYAVNGIARGTKKYREVEEIWLDNPSIPGAKRDIGPIIERGLKLCK
ncbi:MAG: YebY family protein [Acidobacteriota bacterium]|nr:YebY family protein [Acidobacteriota bacterium]